MAKHRESGAEASTQTEPRVAELEQRLAKARAVQAKRAHKLERAQRRGASHTIRAARRRKLRKAQERGDRIQRKLARARSSATPANASAGATPPRAAAVPADGDGAPRAYCIRERQTIVMVEPRQTVMRNGRPALTGLCPSCGSRVSRPIRASSG